MIKFLYFLKTNKYTDPNAFVAIEKIEVYCHLN